jgi:hypothetical protein
MKFIRQLSLDVSVDRPVEAFKQLSMRLIGKASSTALPNHHCSARAMRMLCVAGVTILCGIALNFLTTTSRFQWIPLPPNGTSQPAPAMPFSKAGSRFRDAFNDPRQPIFTRIAAISPVLVALPFTKQDENTNAPEMLDAAPDVTESGSFGDVLLASRPERNASVHFAGVWAPTPNACSPKTNNGRLLPAVIDEDGAWAGEVSCRFRRIKQSGNVAVVTSTCSDGRERWTTKVRLAVLGDRLVWSSDRGSQTYVRCAPRIVEARAGA